MFLVIMIYKRRNSFMINLPNFITVQSVFILNLEKIKVEIE
jgi:hypothetical protein